MRYVAYKTFVDTKDGSDYQSDPVMVAAPTEREAKEQASVMLKVPPEQITVTPY